MLNQLINSPEGAKMNEEVKKYEVIDASPKALALCDASKVKQGERSEDKANAKYPFNSLLVGESFAVPFADTTPGTLASLRSSASSYGKLHSRKYRVIIHNELACVEIARIA